MKQIEANAKVAEAIELLEAARMGQTPTVVRAEKRRAAGLILQSIPARNLCKVPDCLSDALTCVA
jgi:hypothetical protein